MEVSEYLREFEGICDELKVLEVVKVMPFIEAQRHYSRRMVEVRRYAADLFSLLACEHLHDMDVRYLSEQLIAISGISSK